MTETNLIQTLVSLVFSGAFLVIGFFLKKNLKTTDDLVKCTNDMRVTIARIEGKLDVGTSKMQQIEEDIEKLEDQTSKHTLLIHSLDARIGNIETKCELKHP